MCEASRKYTDFTSAPSPTFAQPKGLTGIRIQGLLARAVPRISQQKQAALSNSWFVSTCTAWKVQEATSPRQGQQQPVRPHTKRNIQLTCCSLVLRAKTFEPVRYLWWRKESSKVSISTIAGWGGQRNSHDNTTGALSSFK